MNTILKIGLFAILFLNATRLGAMEQSIPRNLTHLGPMEQSIPPFDNHKQDIRVLTVYDFRIQTQLYQKSSVKFTIPTLVQHICAQIRDEFNTRNPIYIIYEHNEPTRETLTSNIQLNKYFPRMPTDMQGLPHAYIPAHQLCAILTNKNLQEAISYQPFNDISFKFE